MNRKLYNKRDSIIQINTNFLYRSLNADEMKILIVAKCFSVVLVVFAVSAVNVPGSGNNVDDLRNNLKESEIFGK